jgi:hypothetical protein
MTILLPRGGHIQAPKTEGIRELDEVAFIMDTHDKQVIEVMKKTDADEIIKIGSNHLYAVSCRDPQDYEEAWNYGDENIDIFGCYDIQ